MDGLELLAVLLVRGDGGLEGDVSGVYGSVDIDVVDELLGGIDLHRDELADLLDILVVDDPVLVGVRHTDIH